MSVRDAANRSVAIIGGGAAGIFAAIHLAELRPETKITIYEKSQHLLSKVRISGGGRCNVTHACYDPRELVKYYPRGFKQLIGPFNRFAPADIIAWFHDRGVELKTENDGRMFPVTDSSQTIIDTFLEMVAKHRIEIRKSCGIISLTRDEKKWSATFQHGYTESFDLILFATGSSQAIWSLLQKTGFAINPPVPSLFTFNIKEKALHGLSGISISHASVSVPGSKLKTEGPLLLTHWGMSGPAILKLSAWGARIFHDLKYQFSLSVSFLPEENEETLTLKLKGIREQSVKKQVNSFSPFAAIPRRLWIFLIERAGISSNLNWADLANKDIFRLTQELIRGTYTVSGKSTFKDEFVTCGGVALSEIDFKTYESVHFPGLFFAGEVLDVDALTGGFNFQHAWTSGWIAAEGMSDRLNK